MPFTEGQLLFMQNVFIDPDSFLPEDHDMVVSIETEINDELS